MGKLVLVVWVPLLVLATLSAAACAADAAGTGPQVRTLTGRSARFTPQQITVQAGRPVQITLKNRDLVDHDWVIDGLPATEIRDGLRSGHDHAGHDHGAVGTGTIVGHATPALSARV